MTDQRDRTETDAAIDAGQQIATLAGGVTELPREHDIAALAAVVPDGFSLAVVRLEHDNLRDAPRSTVRAVKVDDLDSFAAYITRHEVPEELEVYADAATSRITAILDAPMVGAPSWEAHTVTLRLAETVAWKRWNERNEKWMSQTDFAEHVERSLPDITVPDAQQLLDIVQTFTAKTNVEFESGIRLANGETRLTYRETVTAQAGSAGELDMPKELTIAVRPWMASPGPYVVTARVRYRIRDKQLHLCYVLDRREDLLEAAFDDLVEAVDAAVSGPVFKGPAPV